MRVHTVNVDLYVEEGEIQRGRQHRTRYQSGNRQEQEAIVDKKPAGLVQSNTRTGRGQGNGKAAQEPDPALRMG